MKTSIVISVLLLCLITAGGSAYAEEKEYKPVDKLSRGLFNSFTFLFEIPYNIYKTSVEKDPLTGILYGLPLGVGKSAIRAVVSLVDITTFPFPPYEPLIEPETFFSHKKE